ncbi:MAG TPA: hypothetical protein DIU18_04590 [Gemmatimonadetes bacterium]|nr:hypothetical protein [Gemmatimonadota bacterium]
MLDAALPRPVIRPGQIFAIAWEVVGLGLRPETLLYEVSVELEHIIHDLPIHCLLSKVPESVEVDVNHLGLNEVMVVGLLPELTEAIEAWLGEGVEAAMNRFNRYTRMTIYERRTRGRLIR